MSVKDTVAAVHYEEEESKDEQTDERKSRPSIIMS